MKIEKKVTHRSIEGTFKKTIFKFGPNWLKTQGVQ